MVEGTGGKAGHARSGIRCSSVLLVGLGRCSRFFPHRISCCKETRWLGMHKQTGTRAGNHQRHTHTRRTPAHQRRPTTLLRLFVTSTTLHEPQTAIPQPGHCTGIQPTHVVFRAAAPAWLQSSSAFRNQHVSLQLVWAVHWHAAHLKVT